MDAEGDRAAGVSGIVKKGPQICLYWGVFGPKRRLFGSKNGQNQGFAVTDSLTLPKCKVLIVCMLREIDGPKKDFHRVGGGVPGKQGPGTRDLGTENIAARAIVHTSILRRRKVIICKIRAQKLALGQREAAEIFGGGVNVFSRYENGKTKPPLSLVKLLKVLDRHPDLLNEVKTA